MKVIEIRCGSPTCAAQLTVKLPKSATMAKRVVAVMDALKRSDWKIERDPDDGESRQFCGRCRRQL